MSKKKKTRIRKIKKFIYNNKELFFGLLLGIVVSAVSVKAATILFASSDISYDDTRAGTTVGASDVQDALDEIYALAKGCNENVIDVVISPSNAGSVSPGTMTLAKGTGGTFNVTPNSGYGSGTVSCTNAQAATLARNSDPSTLTINPTADSTCTITYTNVGTYTINLTAANATISGGTSKTATVGGTALYTVTPSSGYGFTTAAGGYHVGGISCTDPSDSSAYPSGTAYIVSSNQLRIGISSPTAGKTYACTITADKTDNFSYTTGSATTKSFHGSMFELDYCCAASFTWNSHSGRFTISGTGYDRNNDYGIQKTSMAKYCVEEGFMSSNPVTPGSACSVSDTEIYKFNSCSTATTSNSSYCWEASSVAYTSNVSSGTNISNW